MRNIKKQNIFAVALQKQAGALAQLVEQWTENPCVPGSIPGGTTRMRKAFIEVSINAFLFIQAKKGEDGNIFSSPLFVCINITSSQIDSLYLCLLFLFLHLK